jgi:protein phosphatase
MTEENPNPPAQTATPQGPLDESAPHVAPEQDPGHSQEESGPQSPAESSEPATLVPVDPQDSPTVTDPATLRLAVSALSDVGCVRTNNEDSYGFVEEHGIYVVCDGMGGMASGEVASAVAVTTVLETFVNSASSAVPVSARLLQAITAANAEVWEKGKVPAHKGMGTTAVVAARDGERLIVGNVGDSRAYIIENDRCIQLTVDHSYLNELIRNGTVKIEDAHNIDLQGMESVITRAVGVAADVEPDFFSIELKPGSAILLVTDGLTRYLLQDEIAAILRASTMDTACANLISVAKQRGGQDNITCLLLVAGPTR